MSSKYFTRAEASETINKGAKYQGDNKRQSRSAYTYMSGAVYTGEWLGGFRDGFGTMIWKDGATYKGDWKLNKACGNG